MKITLENLSKKYHREWIFKNFSAELVSGESYAITGPNGSGKSTLIQVISGALLPTSGTIVYAHQKIISPEDIYQHISIASPYLELIEEFTLFEFLQFHFKFKVIKKGMTIEDVINKTYLDSARNKYIKNFSSGMKQRLKLGLCFFSETPILLFDEPTSNLDEQGIAWYEEHIQSETSEKLILIASNQKAEYAHCRTIIDVNRYKL